MNRTPLPTGTLLKSKYDIDYEILEMAGIGSGALTYKISASNSLRKYVLKELYPSVAYGNFKRVIDDEDGKNGDVIAMDDLSELIFSNQKERFLEENIIGQQIAAEAQVLTLAAVSNCDIVSIKLPYDGCNFVEVDSRRFFVMQDADEAGGEFLETLVKNELYSKNPLKCAINLMVPILQEFEKLHKANYLHLDIQHTNVFMSGTNIEKGIWGRACILDFATAESTENGVTKDLSLKDRFSTPFYRAPEQKYSAFLYEATDVYSLGSLFVYLMTGGKEFDNYKVQIENRFCTEDDDYLVGYHYLGSENYCIKNNINVLLKKALNRNPKSRFTVREMLECMKNLQLMISLPDITFDIDLLNLNAEQVYSLPKEEKLRYIRLMLDTSIPECPSIKDYCGTKRNTIAKSFLEDSEKTALLISANPGAGKTWILSSMANSLSNCAYFFCKRDELSKNNIELMAKSIAYQLASISKVYENFLLKYILFLKEYTEKNPKELFNELITIPLTTLELEKEVVIIIDAIDELRNDYLKSEKGKPNKNSSAIGKTLYDLITRLRTTSVRLVVSSRMENRIIKQAEYSLVACCEKMNLSSEAEDDCNEYICQKLADNTEAIDIIKERAHGLFLYAKLACQYIVQGGLLENLPPDMEGFYNLNFSYYEVANTPKERLLLAVLSMGRIPKRTFFEIEGSRSADELIKKIDAFIEEDTQGNLSFFHKSVYDWLQSDTAGEYYIGSKEKKRTIKKIQKVCLELLSDFGAEQLNEYELNWLTYGIINGYSKKEILAISNRSDIFIRLRKNITEARNSFNFEKAYEYQKAIVELTYDCSLEEKYSDIMLLGKLLDQTHQFSELIDLYNKFIDDLLKANFDESKIAEVYIELSTLSSKIDSSFTKLKTIDYYDTAIRLYRKVYNETGATLGLIKALSEKGWTCRKRQAYRADAESCYVEIEQLQGFLKYENYKAPIFDKDYDTGIGAFLIAEMNYLWTLVDIDKERATKKFEWLNPIYESNIESLSDTFRCQYNFISYQLFFKKLEYEKALHYAKESANLREQTYGPQEVEHANDCNAIANCCIKLSGESKNTQKALAYLDEAIMNAEKSERLRLAYYGRENNYYTYSLDILWQARIAKHKLVNDHLDIEQMIKDYEFIVKFRYSINEKGNAAYAARNCGFHIEKIGNISMAIEWMKKSYSLYVQSGDSIAASGIQKQIERLSGLV